VVELLFAETDGTVVSILFTGEVHVVVLPAISEIPTVQVSPFAPPVVQFPPAVLIPLPPVSVEPDRVKACVPEVLQVLEVGDHVPQVGATLSQL